MYSVIRCITLNDNLTNVLNWTKLFYWPIKKFCDKSYYLQYFVCVANHYKLKHYRHIALPKLIKDHYQHQSHCST